MLLKVSGELFNNMMINHHIIKNIFFNIFKKKLSFLIFKKQNHFNNVKRIPKKIIYRKLDKKDNIINTSFHNFFLNYFHQSYNNIIISKNNFSKHKCISSSILKKHIFKNTIIFAVPHNAMNNINIKKQNINNTISKITNNIKLNFKNILLNFNYFIKKFFSVSFNFNYIKNFYNQRINNDFLSNKNCFFNFLKISLFDISWIQQNALLSYFNNIFCINNLKILDNNQKLYQNISLNDCNLQTFYNVKNSNLFLNKFLLIEELRNKIAQQILILKFNQMNQVKLYLYPKNKGLLCIELNMSNNKNVLNFISQDSRICFALNAAVHDLRKKMKKNGIILDSITIYDHSLFLQKDHNANYIKYYNRNKNYNYNKYSSNRTKPLLKGYKNCILNDNFIHVYV
ncbi:Flagellar hook-length control protein [Buchnera aphidicola (Eriosoma grossulariae)]|uniref:hypothetical protein n=1 Tax=Buchnera aphidicola TaxID=9 RepID=UPI003463B051